MRTDDWETGQDQAKGDKTIAHRLLPLPIITKLADVLKSFGLL